MSDVLDIEIGKDGLEVEASGTVLVVVAGLTFIVGLAVGGMIGFKIGKQVGKRD
jgi:hypothetical protein